jgi:hypothetical protein
VLIHVFTEVPIVDGKSKATRFNFQNRPILQGKQLQGNNRAKQTKGKNQVLNTYSMYVHNLWIKRSNKSATGDLSELFGTRRKIL